MDIETLGAAQRILGRLAANDRELGTKRTTISHVEFCKEFNALSGYEGLGVEISNDGDANASVKLDWHQIWTGYLKRDDAGSYSLRINRKGDERAEAGFRVFKPAIWFDGMDVMGTEDEPQPYGPQPGQPVAKRDAVLVVIELFANQITHWFDNPAA